ncbi:MAG: hypothetical protein ACRENK_05200 [Gemmatimonadaceae bacterium]
MRMRYFAVVVVVAGIGCASGGSTTSSDDTARPHRSSSVITEQEIASSSATTAYEAVEKLHPEFLRSRGETTTGSDSGLPDVYVGTVRYGDTSSLRNIAASNVREIHFYRGAEAGTKYGMQNPNGINGIIEVTLKR